MVVDWIAKRKMQKMGFSFDPTKLTDFDVSCYSIISDKFMELEEAEMKRQQALASLGVKHG